jgi:hypothetical protein
MKGRQLSVGPHGRHLVDQRGQPWFYLADTAWTLFKRLNRQEVEDYLQNRVAKGFTIIQAYLLRGLRVPNLYGDLTVLDGDVTKPNEPFFRNVDDVVERANELGLVMGIVVTYGEHVRQVHTDEQVFNPANAFTFGSYIARRYRDNAVIWLLGGDRKPFEDREVWRAMARGLKEGGAGSHLVSYHGPGGPEPSSSFWFHDEDWLDFNTIQSGHGWAIPNYEFVTRDYHLKPVKPTIDMESRYENHPDMRFDRSRRMDAHQAREAAYWAVLSGAAGHGYGCNDIWQFFDPERRLPGPTDYAFPYDRLPATTHWRQAMDFGGAVGVGFMRKLLELRPWHRMVPDQSLIARGQGEGEDHVQAARAEDGGFILAYLTFGNPVSIHLDRLSGTRVKAQWYDPRKGGFHHVGEFVNAGIGEFLPPSSGPQDDWVLVLEDASRNYPTELPG